MSTGIESLVELAKQDTALDALRANLEKINKEKTDIAAEIERRREESVSFHKDFNQDQLKKKELEIELDTQEQQIAKFQKELNSVKTNEAYRALLNEMETAKQTKSSIEDKLLELMLAADTKQKEMKKKEEEFRIFETQGKNKIAEFSNEESRIATGIEKKVAERAVFVAGINSELRRRYEAIRQNHRGSAVVPVINNSCGSCHMELPPHVVNDVLKNKIIVFCDNCSCILYTERAAESPPHQSSADVVLPLTLEELKGKVIDVK